MSQPALVQLGDASYKGRQQAQAALMRQEAEVVPLLDQALAAKPALELQRRLQMVSEHLTGTLLTGEKLRVYRAVEVLERLDSPDARRLLQRMADGAPGAVATEAARGALRRLSVNPSP